MRTRFSPVLMLIAMVPMLSATSCNPQLSPPGPSGPEPVAILVVDDFDVPSAGKTTHRPADQDCVVTSMGAQVAGGHGATLASVVPPDTSHGHLVYAEIENELTAAGLRPLPSGDTWLKPPGQYGAGGAAEFGIWRAAAQGTPNVIVVGVDTNQYLAQEISARVTTLTNTMRLPTGARIVRYVVNLSFQILPCKFLTEATEVGPEALRLAYYLEVTEQVRELNGLKGSLDQLVGLPEDQLSGALAPYRQQVDDYLNQHASTVAQAVVRRNPLKDVLSTRSGQLQVIPVAASGNGIGEDHQPLPFPTAPAIWDSVVSVGAEDPDHPGQSNATASYSNSAEILQSGVLEYRDSRGRVWPIPGTSFAAPRLAVKEAFYLAAAGHSTSCPGSEFGSVPPLGYSGPPGPGYAWRNLTIQEARQYCTGF